MKENKTNIFVGLSQNQINNYELVIKQLNIQEENNILLTSQTLSFDKSLYNQIYVSNISFDNQSNSLIENLKFIYKKIKNYKHLVKQIEHYKHHKNVWVYFSYIEDILSNYMALSFNKNAKGIVIEDGILNYYKHNLNSLDIKKVLMKYFLSNIMGLRFKLYKGHSSGIDYEHVIKQYVRLPEFSINPKKSEQLIIPKKSIKKFNNSLLILGQEVSEIKLGNKEYYKRITLLFDKATEIAKKKRIKKIYYKPHRHGKRLDNQFIKNKLKDFAYEILNASEPIENLYFNQLKSKYIFGFNSSVIINIPVEIDNKNMPEIYVFLEKNDPLYNLFKYLKVNIYKF